jgi:hypothetical protein
MEELTSVCIKMPTTNELIQPPLIRYHRWNCYNTTLRNGRRTNNVVEGWYSKLAFSIITKHASIWKFLEFIQKNERDNSILTNQLIGGHRLIRHFIKKLYCQ